MIKKIICRTKGHQWVTLVIHPSGWEADEVRKQGEICKRCEKIRNLVDKPKPIPNN